MSVITKRQLVSMIREAVINQLSQMGSDDQTFNYTHLNVGPLEVKFRFINSTPGSRFEPPTDSEVEVLSLSYKGKRVTEEQVVKAENRLLLKQGESPITVEELVEDIENSIRNSQPTV